MVKPRLFLPGGLGRIGGLLSRAWAGRTDLSFQPVFLGRKDWEIGSSKPPILHKDDAVLDLAGKTKGDVSRNAALARHVAEWAQQSGATHFLMSSAAVYTGGSKPMREDEELAPISDYGRSKLASEHAVVETNPGAIILRLGNVAGADALLGGLRRGVPVQLDPADGSEEGPLRSYVGPLVLAKTLEKLVEIGLKQESVPRILNVAQPNPVSMASLLRAAGRDWSFGPVRAGVIARMELCTDRLIGLCYVPSATPEQLVHEAKMAELLR